MKLQELSDKIVIEWNDKSTSTFLYAWLKDNAPKNRHENGQKLTESREIDLNIKPKKVHLENNKIVIDWGDDTTEYSETLLKKNLKNNPSKTTLWSQFTNHELFDYAKVISDNTTLHNCLKNVKEFGFTHLINVPTEEAKILDIVALFGYVRETNYGKYYDVIAKPNPENLADTQLGLPPHTDNPYRNPTPTIQLLHCLKSDTNGGETILVDGFNVATQLKENYLDHFKILSSNTVNFEFRSATHWLQNEAPIIQLDLHQNIEKIKFNSRSIQPFRCNEDIMLSFYKAYQHFENEIQAEKNQLKFKLEPGHAIIYDNERILHGRTSYNLLGERHLQGCYTDRDSLYSKINILESTL